MPQPERLCPFNYARLYIFLGALTAGAHAFVRLLIRAARRRATRMLESGCTGVVPIRFTRGLRIPSDADQRSEVMAIAIPN
jgi:hypothetical protein